MYRFALTPKWILRHVLVLLLIVAMISAGFWQLRRLHDRKAQNADLVAQTSQPVVPIEELLPPDVDRSTLGSIEWRTVTAAGVYVQGRDVVVANRTQGGQPGSWIITPLTLDDGRVVAVVRGFIVRSLIETGGLADAAPATGRVTVTGFLQRSRGGGAYASDTVGPDELAEISRADLGKLAERWGELVPMWVQLQSQDPAVSTATLQPAVRPPLDEGPHFGYAMQWFTFTLIAVIGYPLILRRVAHGDGATEYPDETDETDGTDGPGAGVDDDAVGDEARHGPKVDGTPLVG